MTCLYDIGVQKEKDCKLTLASLYEEIAEENIKDEKENFENIKDKILDVNSGIIAKLGRLLSFRVKDFNEQYNMLKFIKLMYKMEKRKLSGKNKCIRVIDLLSKPALEHIDGRSTNGRVISELMNKIKKEVNSVNEERFAEELNKIDNMWEVLLNNVFYFVTSDNQKNAEAELERVDEFLKSIVKRMPQVKSIEIKYEHPLFDTFYFKLLQYQILSEESDQLSINNQLVEIKKSKDTVTYLSGNNEFVLVNLIDNFCEKNSVTKYSKQIKILIEWMEQYYKYDFSKGVPVSLLESCTEEIILTEEVNQHIKINCHGATNPTRSLIYGLKKPEKVNVIIIKAWLKKCRNRWLYNLKIRNALTVSKSIENSMRCIKKEIMNYYNLTDLVMANDFIFRFARRTLISERYAIEEIAKASEVIYSRTGYKSFIRHRNVYNLYKEIMTCKHMHEDIIDAICKNVLNDEKSLYAVKKANILDIEIYIDDERKNDFKLFYVIDIESKMVYWNNFLQICTDDVVDYYNTLGLNKFIVNN